MRKVKAIQERRWALTHKDLGHCLALATTTSFMISLRLLGPYPTCRKKWLSLEWDELCNQAVGELKNKVSSPPVLKFVEFDKPFEVYTGASDFALAEC